MREIAHPLYGNVRVFDDRDTISRTVAAGHEWEPHITEMIAKRLTLRTNEDMIDAGANLGFIAIGVLIHGAQPTCIHCFEPQTDVCAMLQYNVRRHNRISTYAMALSEGDIGLHSYIVDPTNVGGTILRDQLNRFVVPSTSLDRLQTLGVFPRPVSVMKIDVETHEGPLLAGGRHVFFRAHRPDLFIEIRDEHVTVMERQLAELGYRIERHLGGWDYIATRRVSAQVQIPA